MMLSEPRNWSISSSVRRKSRVFLHDLSLGNRRRSCPEDRFSQQALVFCSSYCTP